MDPPIFEANSERHSTAVFKLDFHNGRILKKPLLFINEFWKLFSMCSACLRDLGPFFRKYPVNLESPRLFSFPPVSVKRPSDSLQFSVVNKGMRLIHIGSRAVVEIIQNHAIKLSSCVAFYGYSPAQDFSVLYVDWVDLTVSSALRPLATANSPRDES